MSKRHNPRGKYPYSVWRTLPCEDCMDAEEWNAKVEAHIDMLRDTYGVHSMYVCSEVREGTRWAKFAISGKVR